MRVITVICVMLIAVSGASAATVQQVTQAVSGVTGDVACLPDDQSWQRFLETNGFPPINAVTWIPERRVRYAPWVCQAIETKNGRVGEALNTVAHEAAHLAGVADEGVAACWGLLWTADLARRFYNVEFFTAESDRLVRQSMFLHAQLPGQYHTVCA